jgi:hypothetical protein
MLMPRARHHGKMAWKKVFERSPVPLAKDTSRSVKATVPLPNLLLLLYLKRALSISLALAEMSLRVFGLWWFASFRSHSASSSRSELVSVWRWWSRAPVPFVSLATAFLTLPTVARAKRPVFRAFVAPTFFAAHQAAAAATSARTAARSLARTLRMGWE